MDEYKKLMLKILAITNTVDDKEAFVEMFTGLLFEETVYNLIQSLPKQRRESVAKKWDANTANAASLTSLIEHNFTKKQITEASEKAAEKAIQEYMQSIDSRLSEEQREQIRKLAKEFTSPGLS